MATKNTPLSISPELTFSQLSKIVDALNELRGNLYYSVHGYSDDKDRFVDEEGRVVAWRVDDAEKSAAKRATLGELIGYLTGETPEEEMSVIAKIRDARRRLDEQDKADKAKAHLEVVE